MFGALGGLDLVPVLEQVVVNQMDEAEEVCHQMMKPQRQYGPFCMLHLD